MAEPIGKGVPVRGSLWSAGSGGEGVYKYGAVGNYYCEHTGQRNELHSRICDGTATTATCFNMLSSALFSAL